jgi:hypothetical protein
LAQVQEQLSPSEKKQLTVVTEPLTLYKGFFRAGVATSYSVIDKVFLENGKRQSLSGNIWGSYWSISTYLQYGVTDRLMVEAFVPYLLETLNQSFYAQDPLTGQEFLVKWNAPSKGLSDLDLTVSYQLITERESRPALGLFITTTLPTGEENPTNIDPNNPNSYNRPTGAGAAAINTTFRLRKVSYPFSYTVSAAYKVKFHGTKVMEPGGDPVDFKDGNFLDLAASFYLHLNDWIVFKNIADYFAFAEDEVDGEKTGGTKWLLNYTPGLSFQIKRLRFDQAITIPIAGKLNAADPGYILIAQYTF